MIFVHRKIALYLARVWRLFANFTRLFEKETFAYHRTSLLNKKFALLCVYLRCFALYRENYAICERLNSDMKMSSMGFRNNVSYTQFYTYFYFLPQYTCNFIIFNISELGLSKL